MSHNSISIIIPSYNRQSIVLNTLKELGNQSVQQFEVIVVDQSPSYNSNLSQYKYDDIEYKYIQIKEVGLPNARNVGANNSKGDILIFIDDDCIPDNNLVQSYISLFSSADPDTWCFGGKVNEKNSDIFMEDASIVGGWITWYGKTLKNFVSDESGECEWAPGGNFAVKRSKFLEVGGFDKNFIGNAMLEDGDFGYTIEENGGKIWYSPMPVIEHLRIPTGGTRSDSTSKGMYFRAHNTVYFMRKHGMNKNMIPGLFYLNGVALKDLLRKKHGIPAIFWCWYGFLKGLTTTLSR